MLATFFIFRNIIGVGGRATHIRPSQVNPKP